MLGQSLPLIASFVSARKSLISSVFALLFDLEDYATTYRATRDALKAANELKLATGPYKAVRDAYVE